MCTSRASPRNPACLLHHPPDILGESNSLAACCQAAASRNKRSCLLQKLLTRVAGAESPGVKVSPASPHVLFWAAALQLPGMLRGAGGSPSWLFPQMASGFGGLLYPLAAKILSRWKVFPYYYFFYGNCSLITLGWASLCLF